MTAVPCGIRKNDGTHIPIFFEGKKQNEFENKKFGKAHCFVGSGYPVAGFGIGGLCKVLQGDLDQKRYQLERAEQYVRGGS